MTGNKKYQLLVGAFPMGIGMMAAPQIVSVEKTHSPTSLNTKLYRHPLAAGNARLEANKGITPCTGI
ncbi:MAG: hypothetical protein QF619_11880 [Candidatus Binatia bacterium]|nr:hypothetical protein [Candidatus Binatia bacterium]